MCAVICFDNKLDSTLANTSSAEGEVTGEERRRTKYNLSTDFYLSSSCDI